MGDVLVALNLVRTSSWPEHVRSVFQISNSWGMSPGNSPPPSPQTLMTGPEPPKQPDIEEEVPQGALSTTFVDTLVQSATDFPISCELSATPPSEPRLATPPPMWPDASSPCSFPSGAPALAWSSHLSSSSFD